MIQKLKVTLAAGIAAAVDLTSIGVGEAEARSRRDRNNAAAAAAMIGVVGTIAAIAAADSRRNRYYDDGYRYRGHRGYRADYGYYRGGYRGYNGGYRGYSGRQHLGAIPPGYHHNGGVPHPSESR